MSTFQCREYILYFLAINNFTAELGDKRASSLKIVGIVTMIPFDEPPKISQFFFLRFDETQFAFDKTLKDSPIA